MYHSNFRYRIVIITLTFRISYWTSYKKLTYNFQQWMSRLPQRWRTQRNAIRNANCKTSWIIKLLNAHCASGICPVACMSECLRIQINHSLEWVANMVLLCSRALLKYFAGICTRQQLSLTITALCIFYVLLCLESYSFTCNQISDL